MKIVRVFALLLFVALLGASLVSAQEDDVCPTIVNNALEATDNACADTGRNEACYGNVLIVAEPQTGSEDFVFEQQGDRVAVSDVQSLNLTPMNEDVGTWGVALLRLQANIPDTMPGQNVTFLVFGNVEITNSEGAMNAFYFQSGVGDAPCEEAPDSGILIQTPAGVGEVMLTVNGVDIALGSTAFLQAEAGDAMVVALVEGHAVVEAEGESQTFETGFQVSVPLDEHLNPTGPPGEPEMVDETQVEVLPVNHLGGDDSEGDDGDGGETGDDDEMDAGGEIVPRSGNWALAHSEVAAEGACPPGMEETMAPSIQQSVAGSDGNVMYVDYGDRFDLQEVYAEAEAQSGVDIVYSNPEPNVYIAAFSGEGFASETIYRLLSEISFIVEVNINIVIPDVGDCVVNVTMDWELVD